MKTGHLIEKLDSESRFFISTLTKAGSDDEFQEYLEVAKLLNDVSHTSPSPAYDFCRVVSTCSKCPLLAGAFETFRE